MKSGLQWLNRAIVVSPIRYCRCTSERAFYRELDRLKMPRSENPYFVKSENHAVTHHFECNNGKVAIVCINPAKRHSPIQVAALLVHEAVHIWQKCRDTIGEDNPSHEFEAYSIQWIAQELMEAYANTLKRKHRRRKRS